VKNLLLAAIMTLALCDPYSVWAQEVITLIGPGGIRASADQIIPGYESKTGLKVKGSFGSGVVAREQAARGDTYDVAIVQPPYPQVLTSGNVVASSETPLANVAVGVAVRQGAPKPDISTPEAVKRMLLAAKFIAYSTPGGASAVGPTVEDMLKKLGIADQVRPMIKLTAGSGPSMELVAKGEAEIGMAFMSEMSVPGVDVIGALPKEIAPPTAYVGFVSTHAKDPAAAKALLEYLSSPEAAPAYKAQHMQPGR
jgi:molybdate transport system substrate-binding protein